MLILLRHGQTAANASGLLQGRADHPLDAVGLDQAERAARALLAAYPGARIVSSPLLRARQTAEAISSEIVVDDRFVELDYGEFDGLAMGEVPAGVWEEWRRDPEFRPPGGESLADLDARVVPALRELAAEARAGDVIVVSHVSPIKAAFAWSLGVGPSASWRCSLDRASITRIAIGPRGPSLMGFNDTSHLS